MKDAVARAAKWLDSVSPGWAAKVDPETLDISDHKLCVLGQVFGDYGVGIRLAVPMWPSYLGAKDFAQEGVFALHESTPYWLEEIQARKSGLPPSTSVQVTDSSLDAAREPQLVG